MKTVTLDIESSKDREDMCKILAKNGYAVKEKSLFKKRGFGTSEKRCVVFQCLSEEVEM